MNTIFIAVILLLVYKTKDVTGCSCGPPRHPQNEFCASSFVMVGKVLSEQLIPAPADKQPDPNLNFAKWRFRVQIWNNIKGYNGLVGTTQYLYTPGNDGVCRVRLKIGKVYALGGKWVDNKREIKLCDFHYEFSQMTDKQLIYTMTRTGPYSYRRNCNCKITSENTSGTCRASNTNANCYARTGVCRKRRGSCRWFNDDCGPLVPLPIRTG